MLTLRTLCPAFAHAEDREAEALLAWMVNPTPENARRIDVTKAAADTLHRRALNGWHHRRER